MASNSNPSVKPNAGVLMALINRLRLLARLLKDGRVPLFLKVIPFAPLLYLLFPLDVVPDVIPIVGQLDDLGIAILGIEMFINLAPQDVVREHQAQIESGAGGTYTPPPPPDAASGNVVDGEWRRVK